MLINLIRRGLIFISNPKYYFYIYYNRLLFHLNGVKFGKELKIYDSIFFKIKYDSIICIGNKFTFSSGGGYNSLCRNLKGCIDVREGAKLVIGNNVGMSSSVIWCSKKIIIGDNVKIGGDTIILDTDAHSLDYKVRNSKQDSVKANKESIIIEDDVLIGTRCIILKGVTIGARSIIAAGSVVTKSIPSDCIAGGNPCKILRVINNE